MQDTPKQLQLSLKNIKPSSLFKLVGEMSSLITSFELHDAAGEVQSTWAEEGLSGVELKDSDPDCLFKMSKTSAESVFDCKSESEALPYAHVFPIKDRLIGTVFKLTCQEKLKELSQSHFFRLQQQDNQIVLFSPKKTISKFLRQAIIELLIPLRAVLVDHARVVEVVHNSPYLQERLICPGVQIKFIYHNFKPSLLLYSTTGIEEEFMAARAEDVCFRPIFRYQIRQKGSKREGLILRHFERLCSNQLQQIGEDFRVKLEICLKPGVILGHGMADCFKIDLKKRLDRLVDQVCLISFELSNQKHPNALYVLTKEGLMCEQDENTVSLIINSVDLSSQKIAQFVAEAFEQPNDLSLQLEVQLTHYSNRMLRQIRKRLNSAKDSITGSLNSDKSTLELELRIKTAEKQLEILVKFLKACVTLTE